MKPDSALCQLNVPDIRGFWWIETAWWQQLLTVELVSVVAALAVEVSVSEVAVSAETEVGSLAVVGVVVVSGSSVVVGAGGVVAAVSGVVSGAAAVVPVAFRQKPLAYCTTAAESSAEHDWFAQSRIPFSKLALPQRHWSVTGTQPMLVLMLLTQFCCRVMLAHGHLETCNVKNSAAPGPKCQASLMISQPPNPFPVP
jgi:hypothetical protein